MNIREELLLKEFIKNFEEYFNNTKDYSTESVIEEMIDKHDLRPSELKSLIENNKEFIVSKLDLEAMNNAYIDAKQHSNEGFEYINENLQYYVYITDYGSIADLALYKADENQNDLFFNKGMEYLVAHNIVDNNDVGALSKYDDGEIEEILQSNLSNDKKIEKIAKELTDLKYVFDRLDYDDVIYLVSGYYRNYYESDIDHRDSKKEQEMIEFILFDAFHHNYDVETEITIDNFIAQAAYDKNILNAEEFEERWSLDSRIEARMEIANDDQAVKSKRTFKP